jgi:hypothetical protein
LEHNVCNRSEEKITKQRSLKFVILTTHCQGNQIKKDETDGARRTQGTDDEYIGHDVLVGNHEEKILWRVPPCAGTVEERSIETGMQ